MDDLEDDWAILRRNPYETNLPGAVGIAEAMERVCKTVVEYAILTAQDPIAFRRGIEAKNQFPILSLMPFYDLSNKKRLWIAKVMYEAGEVRFSSENHVCVEEAMADLFAKVSVALEEKAKTIGDEAEGLEREMHLARDISRKVRLLKSAMGSFNPQQPNLPLSKG